MSKSPKVTGSQGPRYLKVKFKYKIDSKEGPSYCQAKVKVQILIIGTPLTHPIKTFQNQNNF